MRSILGSLLVAILVGGSMAAVGRDEPALAPPFTVHEWGTFTTRVDVRGEEIVFERAPDRFELPPFVHYENAGRRKVAATGTVRMETPVLYVHTEHPVVLDVDVRFPGNTITEWYPDFGLDPALPNVWTRPEDRLIWKGIRAEPLATSNARLWTSLSGAPYYCARGVDAAVLTVTTWAGIDESEKFLFYRGTGSFPTPLFVVAEGGTVKVRNRGAQRIDQVMLFERDERGLAYDIHCTLDPNEEFAFGRAQLQFGPELWLDDLKKILRGQGLREDEAQAMVDTWRESWFEPGLRVLYTVPREVTDAVLPLTITPVPQTTVRVLIGRTDVAEVPVLPPAPNPSSEAARGDG
ncbi:MAG: hypothetical protein IPH13_01700 [Planctomycetes bacterium]|nr:hypothetical protein [Planctomycetota bacterium]